MTQPAPAPRRTNGLGIAGFVLSIIAICTGGLLSPIALLICVIALLRRPRGFAFAGFIVSFIGTAFIGFIISVFGLAFFSGVKYGKPYFVTLQSIAECRNAVDTYTNAHGNSLPDSLTGTLMIDGHNDGWNHFLKYRQISDTKYEIASAGQDGTWGNDDDIKIELDRK